MKNEKMFDIGARIKLEKDTEFRNAVTGINKSLSAMQSELKLVSAQYEGNANSLDALRAKQEVLNRILDEHKKKVTATNTALQNAKTQRDNLQVTLERNLEQFDKENEKLEELKRTYGNASDEVKKQKAALADLEYKINRGTSEYDKASNKINEWQTKLNTAEAQVISATKAVNRNAAYMKEAEEATDHCASSIDEFGKEIQKVQAKTDTFGNSLKANLVGKAVSATGEALKNLGRNAYEGATELEKAGNQIEASTSLTGKALREYKDTLQEVYANNYGDSMEDVSETIGKITHNLGELNKSSLQNVTESAITLRDTFDMDINETIRGARNLMYQFGLSAEEAFDMMGKGAKEGLNYTDELGDNVSEYAGNFAQAGYSASEYFQLLKNGSSNGAYNLDKVNDAINEVTNRLADGSVEKEIESFSAETQNIFREWQEGGTTQKQVIDSIVNDISTCTNEQQALTMAATAFGTMGEDANLKFVQSLTSVGDTFTTVKGTMEGIKDVKYDDLNSQITEISRSIQMKLGDQVKRLLPEAADGLQLVEEHLELVEGGIMGLTTAASLCALFKSNYFSTAIKGLSSLSNTMGATTAATKLMSLTTAAVPWTAIAAGAGVAAGAIVALWAASGNAKTESEQQADKVRELADAYKDLEKAAKEGKDAFEGAKKDVVTDSESMQRMADRIYELAKSGNALGESKAEIQAYINLLNEAIPGLNLSLNEQTGELNLLKTTVDDYISSMKQTAISDVYGGQISEISGRIAEANQNVVSAMEEKAKAEERLAEIENERNSILKENEDLTGAAGAKLGELNTEESLLNDTVESCNKSIDKYNKYIKEAEEEQNSLGNEIESTTKSMGLLTDETNSNTQAEKENALAAKDVAASADTQKEALDSLKEKFEETKQSIRDGLEDKINLFDVFDGGEDLSVDKMAENMESQLEGVQNYKENLEKLKEAVGTEIAPEFMQYIEDMGLEGANLVANMAEAMDSEDAKAKLKQASDNYMSYLDETDEIAEAGAANKMALDASLGELGSSKADFSALEESVKEAASSTVAGWSGLTEGTRQALNETIQAAQECGVQIPDGLAEGIRSGEVAPEETISQLKGSIQGQFDYFSEIAKDAGIQIPDGLETGISQGGDAAVRAMTELYNLILNTQRESEGASEEAGKKNAQAAGQGIEKASSEVSQKTGEVMKQAASTANSYGGSFTSVGYNMMSGVAIGLNSGSGLVYNKIQQILDEAKRRANKINDSRSPSRVWRDQVGLYMAQGLAQGVDKGKKDVVDAVTGMADESLKAAKDELGIQSPSKVFKDQVGAQISEGTALGVKLKKKKSKKAAKEMAQEVAQAAEEAYENYQKNNVSKINATLDDEQYMWEQLVKKAKKGGKTYQKEIKKLAKEHLKEIEQKRKAERLDTQETALDAYKTYYDVSPKAEMKYWDTARRKYKDGTDQRLEADKKYFEAKESYYEKLEDLEDEYYEKCQDVKDKLQDDIDELKKSYNQAFDERRSAIKDAFGLFDEFASESETPEKLLANMQSQVQGYALWMEQLSELEGKNILDSDFLSELREMGPDAAATILSLNMMTDEQLRLANEAYEEKNRLAEAQAAKETETLRKETEDKISVATKEAQAELDAYKQEYQSSVNEINTGISDSLKKLAKDSYNSGVDAVANLIKGIKDKTSAKDTDKQLKGVQKQIADGLDGLPAKGKTIGKDTLAGILKGLSNGLEIKKGAKSFVDELEDAIRKEADMHSPSKRFEKLSIDIPAGSANGIKKGTPMAVTASTDMVKAMLDESKKKISQQQEALQQYLSGIHAGSGIAALNNLAAQAVTQTNVTVNNTGATDMMHGIVAEIRGLKEAIWSMGIYIDEDNLVGCISEKMGNELAGAARKVR